MLLLQNLQKLYFRAFSKNFMNVCSANTPKNFYTQIAKDVDEMIAELTKLAGELQSLALNTGEPTAPVYVDFEMVSPQIVLLWEFNTASTFCCFQRRREESIPWSSLKGKYHKGEIGFGDGRRRTLLLN
jgi:hypothetical protein